MVSSATFFLLATCFVLSNQLPTSPVRPAEEHDGQIKPVENKPVESGPTYHHPAPSTFLKDDEKSVKPSTRRTDYLNRVPTTTGSSVINNNNNNYRRPATYNQPQVPSAIPLAVNPPTIKTVRETPSIDAFKAHEAASSSSRTTESSKTPESSSTTEGSKRVFEPRPPATLAKDGEHENKNVHTSSIQKIPANTHHAVKRDDAFAKIFVVDPYALQFEPESSFIGSKKFKVLPSFMG